VGGGSKKKKRVGEKRKGRGRKKTFWRSLFALAVKIGGV